MVTIFNGIPMRQIYFSLSAFLGNFVSVFDCFVSIGGRWNKSVIWWNM